MFNEPVMRVSLHQLHFEGAVALQLSKTNADVLTGVASVRLCDAYDLLFRKPAAVVSFEKANEALFERYAFGSHACALAGDKRAIAAVLSARKNFFLSVCAPAVPRVFRGTPEGNVGTKILK